MDVVNVSLADLTGEKCDSQIQIATNAIQVMLTTSAGRAALKVFRG
jgi:hypothetical protein